MSVRIERIRVTVMMVSSDGRAIDRTVALDRVDPSASPESEAANLAEQAATLVLERLSGLDNRRG